MRLIGIDPSWTATTFCFWDGRSHRFLALTDHSRLPEVERLALLVGQFKEELQRFAPEAVALEDYAFGSPTRLASTGMLGGAYRLALYELEIPTLMVSPNSVKVFAAGEGSAQKDQMLLYVYKRWGVTCRKHDEADAYSLMQALRATIGDPGVTTTQAQRKTLAKAVPLHPQQPLPAFRPAVPSVPRRVRVLAAG